MKGNTIFLESATANIGDLEALIPIMLDPGNQISFKSGHCRVGDQVVVLPAWGKKDQFIAIKGWGAYEVTNEGTLYFNKLDWIYEGYPARCTTYDDGYIWKERFEWTTIPNVPYGYPDYYDLRVMRKGLNGHPDVHITNYPQNCSDGTSVYYDDLNVLYSIADPYIAEGFHLPYGADYKHYYYTAFPSRDGICGTIELGSTWYDDAFCPAYVEPPAENPDGISATYYQDSITVSWPLSDNIDDLILIRFKKSETPPTVVPTPLDSEYGVIEGHGDLVYFGYRNNGPGNFTHENLEYLETYTYTIWNIETRLDEDGDPIYVYNSYEDGGWHYPRTDPVYVTLLLEAPAAINLILNSTFDENLYGWIPHTVDGQPAVIWISDGEGGGKARFNLQWTCVMYHSTQPGLHPTTIIRNRVQTLFFELSSGSCPIYYGQRALAGIGLDFRTLDPGDPSGYTTIVNFLFTPCADISPVGPISRQIIVKGISMETLQGMTLEEIYETYKTQGDNLYEHQDWTWAECCIDAVMVSLFGNTYRTVDNIYLWEHVSNKCDINGDPIIE
jgi:hypothetical protein